MSYVHVRDISQSSCGPLGNILSDIYVICAKSIFKGMTLAVLVIFYQKAKSQKN